MAGGDFLGIGAQLVLRGGIGMSANQIDGIADQRQLARGVDHDQPVARWRNQSTRYLGLKLL